VLIFRKRKKEEEEKPESKAAAAQENRFTTIGLSQVQNKKIETSDLQ
jgi:hypothetical protein